MDKENYDSFKTSNQDNLIEELDATIWEQIRDVEEEEELTLDNLEDKLDNIGNLLAGNILSEDVPQKNIGFQVRLWEIWGEAIKKLDLLIQTSLEIGKELQDLSDEENSESNNYLYNALTNIHSTTLRTAQEIVLLLEKGFADGAMARWRQLYEASVISFFIRENPECAETFLVHRHLQRYHQAVKLKQNAIDISVDDETLSDLGTQKNQIIKDYNCFDKGKRDYEWAQPAFQKEQIKLTDLADSVFCNP